MGAALAQRCIQGMQPRKKKRLPAAGGPGKQARIQDEDRDHGTGRLRSLKSRIVRQAQVPANPPD
jgi:hypothetical protein